MADSEEEIYEFLTEILKNNCASLEDVKQKICEKYKVQLMQNDLTIIEDYFANITLKLWEEECKTLIEQEMQSGASNVHSLVMEFNALRDFSTTPSLLKTERYLIILKDILHFNENSLFTLFNNLKRLVNLKVEQIKKDESDKFQFSRLFQDVLKSPEWNLKHLLYFLERLQVFADDEMEIFLKGILDVIINNKFLIDSYTELQRLASNLLQNDSFVENKLYSEIHQYIKSTTFNFNNGILKVDGKAVFMQDVLENYSNHLNIKEIVISCETLHIHKTESSSFFHFKVDNLVILAETIKIHHEVTIDLSGKPVEPLKSLKAGTSLDGTGLNGEDGLAGEYGGNCKISCSSIFNSELLTIQSNGSNGSDGQDGGDGSDGIDGMDVEKPDFTYIGEMFKMGILQIMPFKGTRTYKNGDIAVHYVVQNVGYTNCYKFMLCKGTDGTKGKLGGFFGYGGEEGLAGVIEISVPNDVKIVACRGMQGKNGKSGYNGVSGKDGRDAWAYDSCYENSTLFVGLDKFCKYELVRKATSGNHDAWSRDEKAYISAKEIGPVKSVSSFKVRNEAVNMRLRAAHAIAERKASASKNLKRQSKNPLTNQSLKYDNIHVDNEMITIKEQVRVNSSYKNALSVNKNVIQLEFLKTVNFSFQEVKDKIFDNDFVNILEKSNLTTENYSEIKKYIENENTIKKAEVILIIDQKIALITIRENLQSKIKEINENFKIQDKPIEVIETIPYLRLSETFDAKFESLNYKDLNKIKFHEYFNTDSSNIRKDILKLFTSTKNKLSGGSWSLNKDVVAKITNFFGKDDEISSLIGLHMGIVEILFKFKSEIMELESILRDFGAKYQNSIKNIFNKYYISPDDIKNIQSFLKEFYDDKNISNFIANNLIEQGILSPIYKKIVAFAFNVNLKIFYRKIDGNLCYIGSFEAKEKFEGLSSNQEIKDNSVNLNLLMDKGVYTILDFDKENFSRDCFRERLAKHKPKDFNLFLNNNADRKWEKLVESIINNITSITDEELDQIKMMLDNIKLSGGLSILNSISVCLKYEENQMPFEELNLILLIVLKMICDNSFMVDYFETKFLALRHNKWIVEIILLVIEDYLNLNDFEIVSQWRKILQSLSCRKILVLFLNEIIKLEESEVSKNGFCAIMENMKYFSSNNYTDLIQLNDLNSWTQVITTQYWLNTFTFLTQNEGLVINELLSKFKSVHIEKLLTIMQKKQSGLEDIKVNEFLQNFNTGEWIFSDCLFNILENNEVKEWIAKIKSMYNVEGGQRSIEQITMLIKDNKDTSDTIIKNADKISEQANNFIINKPEVENFDKDKIKAWFKDKKRLNSTLDRLLYISQVFKLKTGNELRNTQIISLLTLWESQNSSLIQVSTGEGKTIIGVALSILKFLNKEKVHIVTSSNVLAERDATNKINCEIFNFFGIKVGHNCSESSDERRRAYKECDVVYGSLGNFQRDYLLTIFFEENFFDTENLQNVIVDEVDSILLDKGHNILYLSQELPCVDELQSLFIFIWQYVNQQTDDFNIKQDMLKPENMRAAVIENWIGSIDEVQIQKIICDDLDVKSDDIVKKLQDSGFIDNNLMFCSNKSKSITDVSLRASLSSLKLSNDSLDQIVYYILRILKLPKSISFPNFLNKFVLNHLDRWISSALTAICMEDGREYVIDRVQTSNTQDLDPNIIIMDVETGTDLKSSEWDEALCQFLQLKHGCRLSLYSLKSIFISNVSYFKLYKKLFGMSGTLGSNYERLKLTEFYQLDYVTIPTFLPKKFTEFEAISTKSSENWISEVLKDAKAMLENERSVLVICNTIKDIQTFKAAFDNSSYFKNIKIHTYQRDYEVFNLHDLGPNNLIIATNLAGRGTDIKLSKELESNGGLHVILTYLASNVRIESQAFGRASRAGSKGSARLIVSNVSDQTIQELKCERDGAELTRLDSVVTYYNNFISAEEGLFSLFMKAYKSFLSNHKDKELQKILLDNLKISWTFWLDENSERIKDFQIEKKETHKFFEDFLLKVTHKEYNKNNLHPMTRLKLARYFDKKKDFQKAKEVLQIELNDGILEQQDWDALNYMSNYIILKEKSSKGDYKNRSLEPLEIITLKNTLRVFLRKENEESARETFITAHKDRKTLFPINGYENHNKNILNIKKVVTDSLIKFLGTGITPESFNCKPFGNQLLNEKFYDDLITKDYITRPSIALNFDKSYLDTVSKTFSLDGAKFSDFIVNKKGKSIDSMEKFANEIEKILIFPSREHFWSILEKNELLINSVKYAIIDYKTIKDFNPKTADEIFKLCENSLIKEFQVENHAEIFLYNVDKDNELIKTSDEFPEKLAVNLNHSCDQLQALIPSNLIKINYKAEFNVKKFIEGNFNFENFDSMTKDDLNFIKSDLIRENLLKTLSEQEILLKSPKNSSIFHINFKNLADLNLNNNFVYKDELLEVIDAKFSYRYALEHLARKIQENIANNVNSQNESIKLCLNPHLMIVHDLLDHFIIEKSKVNKEKINSLEDDLFKNSLTKEEMLSFLRKYLPETINCKELLDELLSKNASFLDNLKITLQVKLSSKFKDIESDVQELLARKRLFIENKENIIKTIKDGVEQLNNNTYSRPCPVLISLKTLCPEIDDDLLNHMKLMGLDYIVQIKDDTYTIRYFWDVFLLCLMGLTQIAFGHFMNQQHVSDNGINLIKEGFSDIAYALSTLFSGTFSWKEYGYQKVWRVACSFAKMIYSKSSSIIMKWLALGRQNDQQNAENVSPKVSIHYLLSKGKEAGLSILLNRLLEEALDVLKKRLSTQCTNALQGNFLEHDVSSTINNLLVKNSKTFVLDLVKKYVTMILNEQAYINSMLSNTLNFVRTSVNSGEIVNQKLITGLTMASQTITTAVMVFEIKLILSNLNEKLMKHVTEEKNSPKNDHDNFKSQVLKEIHSKVSLSFNGSINQNIFMPLKNHCANKTIKKTTAGTNWMFKDLTKRSDTLLKAAKLTKKLENSQEEKAVEIDYTENINRSLFKLKISSKDPKVVAYLSKLDLPVSYAEMEAAAQVFKVILVLTNDNINHRFGYMGYEVKIDDYSTITSFYRCLKDETGTTLSLEEFKEKIAKEILENPRIAETKDSESEYFYKIGFYGREAKRKYDYAANRTRSNSKEPEGVKHDEKMSSPRHIIDKSEVVVKFNENLNNPSIIEAEEIKIVESTNDDSQETDVTSSEPIELAVDAEESFITTQEKELTSDHGQNENESEPAVIKNEEQKDEKLSIVSSSTTAPIASTSTKTDDEITMCVKVVFEGYPRDILNDDQAHDIKEHIENCIMDDDSDCMPSFHSFEHSEGILSITCNNQVTADWLEQAIKNFEVDGKVLTLYHGDSIPKLPSFSMFIQGKRCDFERYKMIIAKQNKGLNTHLWMLTNKIDMEEGHTLVFTVDCDSAIKLEELNFEISGGLTKLILKKENDEKESLNASEGSKEVN